MWVLGLASSQILHQRLTSKTVRTPESWRNHDEQLCWMYGSLSGTNLKQLFAPAKTSPEHQNQTNYSGNSSLQK